MTSSATARVPTSRSTRRSGTGPCSQRGAALLTAMIIVTLVSTLAAAMVWQQWRAVQVESAERDRVQAAWTLSSALQFASLVLRENKGKYTALTDFWATPLAEGRVSTLNGTDKTTADDDDSQGFLSGSIEDAQSRYNLLNLITPASAASAPPGQPAPATGTTPIQYKEDPLQLPILASLCQSANVDSSVAAQIASGLAAAANVTGGGAPLMPETVDQLVWLGIDRASVDALRPYVALLSDPSTPSISKVAKVTTKVNVNTASSAVLSALINSGAAQTILQRRQRTPFKTPAELETALGLGANDWLSLSQYVDVHSFYFEVRGRLRLADRVLAQQSLVFRDSNLRDHALRSERVSSVETVGP